MIDLRALAASIVTLPLALALAACGSDPSSPSSASGSATSAAAKTSASAASSGAAKAPSSAAPTASASSATTAAAPPKLDGFKACEAPDDAKVDEVRNFLGAVARGALAGYEREMVAQDLLSEGEQPAEVSHALCKSSTTVPADVPKGSSPYKPSGDDGKDFSTGDATTGWRCLKFAVSSTMYSQLTYKQGSGYLGPARGLPDPGPGGFEVSGVQDLDGDGKTSLFVQIGWVDEATKTVRLATSLYCADPGE
ncbi:MAG: hypothetical protein IPM79_03915 [Polyangiaceae bacterium]|nr:hypothetical protein [Polyangiaceae bacterium]MBK8936803.1 hypothetical protein [Polyangiaceae bacterium]